MKPITVKRYIIIIAGSVPVSILAYLLFAFLLSVIPVNTDFREPVSGIDIYILSNGVHTDIVVPAESDLKDWSNVLRPSVVPDAKPQYIAFGWGDKGFYLNTPTWSDLKISTAFNALFWRGTSAVHVTYYSNLPSNSDRLKKIRISEEQYLSIINHIQDSFMTVNSLFVPIEGYHYNGVNDEFYEGVGKYNLFRTCNCWTNEGLKKAGIKTALWAPFEKSIMIHR